VYRVIRSFTIGNKTYNIGDLVEESDNQAIEEDPLFQKYVVRIVPEELPNL
jgi:hypothetical protein